MMKLRTQNGKVEPISFFKFVFVGHFVGLTLIFAPLFVLAAIASIFVPIETGSGHGGFAVWLGPFMVPLIAAGQGLIFGGVVTLGLWLYTRKHKIMIEEVK